jgi:hypothetical protein
MLNCGTRCLVHQRVARKRCWFSSSFTVVRLYSNSKRCPLIYKIQYQIGVISGFRCEVFGNCAILDYYAANSGDFSPTFRDNLSVPSAVWVITQRVVVISYRRFGTTYPSHPQSVITQRVVVIYYRRFERTYRSYLQSSRILFYSSWIFEP